MEKVVVIIPIYKEVPSSEESRSMVQTLNKLNNFQLIIVGPNNISYDAYYDLGYKKDQVKIFSAEHFKDIRTYNKMLCSKWFYKAFENYEYMLIIQNDAWVFRDELNEWCLKDYDYVGAPWIWKPDQVKAKVFIELFPLMRNQVGNGGVSLRRTNKFIRLSPWASLLFSLLGKNEDFIWLLVAKIPFVNIIKPEIKEALQFCIEMEPATSMEMIGNNLPFTAHAYNRYGSVFWKKYM